MKDYSYCNIVGKTDVGCKRSGNEDWLDSFECRNGLVAVVCDGMGGHVGGEVASHLAIETIRKFLETNYFDDPRQAIIEACDAANEAIIDRTVEKPELTGMGATCVMLIVRDGKVYYGSVGDSRIYLVRSKRITQLTVDQSYVQMLVDMGEITKEQAEHHPRKNEITNALGLDSMKPATVAEVPIDPEAGDCFILCSDGLSGMVPDNAILKIAADQQRMSQRDRVDALISLAKKNGGLDNITCQIVEFAVTPSQVAAAEQKKKKTGIYAAIIAAAVIVIAAVVVLLLRKPDTDKNSSDNALMTQMSKPNTSIRNFGDTIRYVENKPFLTLTENHTYNSLEIEVYSDGKLLDTLVDRHSVKLGDVKFFPKSDVTTQITGDKMNVALKSGADNDTNITLTFSAGDSTFIYVFPVKLIKSPAKQPNTVTPLAPPAGKKGPSEPVIVDNTSQPDTPDNDDRNDEQPLEVSINVSTTENSTEITLSSKKGKNTATQLFTDYAIGIISERTNWYSVNCRNRSTCKIIVNNKKVPVSNAVISIPLDNADGKSYKIHVKPLSTI